MKPDTFLKAMGNIEDKYLDTDLPKKKIKHSFGKWFAGIAAAAVLLACPLPAMTALGSDTAYSVLYKIAPTIAQDFKPVQKSCTYDDIEMTVISAKCDGSKAEVYLAMRDTTGECPYGDWDLYDSYYINVPRDMNGHCSFSEYDEDTHTAYFVVELETMNGSKMPKKKVTFSVSELLIGKKKTVGTVNVDMSAIPIEPETVLRDDIGSGTGFGELPDCRDYRFLVPAEKPILCPADNVSMESIGYLDGALHVLMRYEDNFHTDSHGWVHLVDKNGLSVVSEENVISFMYWYNEEHTDMCYEYILPVEYEKLLNCTLCGEFSTALEYRSGKWQVTFPLE